MNPIDQKTMEVFWDHCDWAHQCWHFRKYMYDENPQVDKLRRSHHVYFFNRLYKILQEYWMHEVAKLLDPAKQNGFHNLSVNYIYEAGDWSQEVKANLGVLQGSLMGFGALLKPARNKLLSHKDKSTILSGEDLGAFDEGSDIEFFKTLKVFANQANSALGGTLLVYDNLTKNDIDIFMNTFSKGFDNA
jgi:hypothetical protein